MQYVCTSVLSQSHSAVKYQDKIAQSTLTTKVIGGFFDKWYFKEIIKKIYKGTFLQSIQEVVKLSELSQIVCRACNFTLCWQLSWAPFTARLFAKTLFIFNALTHNVLENRYVFP